jgi:hypothetical protein
MSEVVLAGVETANPTRLADANIGSAARPNITRVDILFAIGLSGASSRDGIRAISRLWLHHDFAEDPTNR